MLNDNLLDNSPGWLIFFLMLTLMLAGNYYGYKFGLWHKKSMPNADESSNGELMGAIFGVLGFTLAFLFGMSLTRLEHKKEIVMDEACAILAAYQQSQFLPEPHKSQSATMIRSYAKLRYELATEARQNRDIKSLNKGILLSEHIQDSLLRVGMAAGKIAETDASSFLSSVSNLIDINMRRIHNATGDRIPRALKILMYAMSLLGLAAIGYSSGLKGGRSLVANFILVIVFATIIGIILDIDHPINSLFKISQDPILDVMRRIGSIS